MAATTPIRTTRAPTRAWLLAKLAEQGARTLQVVAWSRVRVRDQAHRETDHDRVDAGLEQREPAGAREEEVQQADADIEPPDGQDDAEDRQPDE
jgi:hypothetical protein